MARASRFADDVDEDDFDGYPGEDLEDEDVDADDDLDEDDVDEEAREFFGELTLEDSVARIAAAAGDRDSWYQGGRIVVPAGEMTCRGCGCSDSRGCWGGCLWAAPNLCSRCVS